MSRLLDGFSVSMRRALRSAHSGLRGLSIPQDSLVDSKLRLRVGGLPERPITTVEEEVRAGVLWGPRHGVAKKG